MHWQNLIARKTTDKLGVKTFGRIKSGKKD